MSSFEDIKVGEKLILHSRNGSSVVTVGRLTAKQLVTEKPEYKFWKRNGSEVGGSVWDHNHITKATDEEIQKVRAGNRVKRKANEVRHLITTANLSLFGEENLDVILEVIEKVKAKEKN